MMAHALAHATGLANGPALLASLTHAYHVPLEAESMPPLLLTSDAFVRSGAVRFKTTRFRSVFAVRFKTARWPPAGGIKPHGTGLNGFQRFMEAVIKKVPNCSAVVVRPSVAKIRPASKGPNHVESLKKMSWATKVAMAFAPPIFLS
jgi:hypothetical protein